MLKSPRFLVLGFIVFAVFFHAAPAASAKTVLTAENGRSLTGTLVFRDSPLISMTEIPFRLDVTDPGGAAVDIQSAACDLTMPAMPMPENRPTLSCDGSFCTGTAVFTMAGAWDVTFGLVTRDGRHDSIVFRIDMVRMK